MKRRNRVEKRGIPLEKEREREGGKESEREIERVEYPFIPAVSAEQCPFSGNGPAVPSSPNMLAIKAE